MSAVFDRRDGTVDQYRSRKKAYKPKHHRRNVRILEPAVPRRYEKADDFISVARVIAEQICIADAVFAVKFADYRTSVIGIVVAKAVDLHHSRLHARVVKGEVDVKPDHALTDLRLDERRVAARLERDLRQHRHQKKQHDRRGTECEQDRIMSLCFVHRLLLLRFVYNCLGSSLRCFLRS